MKKGMLYRSGVLQKLIANDHKVIGALHVQTVVDFRSLEEQAKNPGTLPGRNRVSLPCNIDQMTREKLRPLLLKRFADDRIVEAIDEVYLDMVDLMLEPMGRLVRLILEPDSLPLIIHCRAGKDRTGFAAAMIQWFMGVDKDLIMKDYLKSNDFITPKISRALRRFRLLTLGLVPKANLQAAFEVREQYLTTAMQKVETEYGGPEGYFMRGGVAQEELDKLTDRLIED
jgi:protein-tyrosine phosphatase